jgi:3-deoxy-D-manno-octulosonate 8-phosphate phosphatase (KDO 8-P phosphatase)
MHTLSPEAQSDILWFKTILTHKELIDKLKRIKLVIADVDGSLTNTLIAVDAHGEGARQFNIQDGYITVKAQTAGVIISFMSGKDNSSTLQRAQKLGIPAEHCAVGLLSKPEAVEALQKKLGLTSDQTLIFGDDYLDVEVKLKNAAGIFSCPSNAVFYIQPHADFVVPKAGGDGAFRLLLDLLLYVQDKHFAGNMITHALD